MSGQYNHVIKIDLLKDNVLEEIIVMKTEPSTGDIYFIAVQDLDPIDRDRVVNMLKKRDANRIPLWDLMSQTTLKNGMNALEFFHQLVKIRTETGKIFSVHSGKTGTVRGSLSAEAGFGEAPTVTDAPAQPAKKAKTPAAE